MMTAKEALNAFKDQTSNAFRDVLELHRNGVALTFAMTQMTTKKKIKMMKMIMKKAQVADFGCGCIGRKATTGRNPIVKGSTACSVTGVLAETGIKSVFKHVMVTTQNLSSTKEVAMKQI
jgi:hypothetical protein